MTRNILHCDMNNFYASVECMLNPELKQYPVAVCGSVEERHGIVLAKNYKAKAFKVATGDAVWQVLVEDEDARRRHQEGPGRGDPEEEHSHRGAEATRLL